MMAKKRSKKVLAKDAPAEPTELTEEHRAQLQEIIKKASAEAPEKAPKPKSEMVHGFLRPKK